MNDGRGAVRSDHSQPGFQGWTTCSGEASRSCPSTSSSAVPGTGKTTLAHQILFANATADRPGLYFTIVGEPSLKMLRYQQQYSFFDPAKVNGVIRFSSLAERYSSASRRSSRASCVRSKR